MRRPAFLGRCILVGFSLAFCAGGLRALEGDQYYAWDREIADATLAINAKIELEIGRALDEINGRDSWERLECPEVVSRIVPRFRQWIFQEIELWATNSSLVDRVPAAGEEQRAYRDRYIYRDTGPLDLGTKVPPSPTIEVAGVRFSTDKLSHFFAEGWMYTRWYRKAVRRGASPEEAEQRAIRNGILWERTILGLVSSGVFSVSDLEANYQGMLFLVGLCDGASPGLVRTAEGWKHVRPFDLAAHVSPEWDESYATPIFGSWRWPRIREALLDYCPMLDDPRVVERRRDYARRDRTTPTERIVDELVRRGKLADPACYSLEEACFTEGLSTREDPAALASLAADPDP